MLLPRATGVLLGLALGTIAAHSTVAIAQVTCRQPPVLGVVLSVNGIWTVRGAGVGRDTVQRGRAVCASDVLTAAAGEKRAHIVVLSADGRRLERACAVSACAPLVIAMGSQSIASRVRRFFDAVVSGLHEDPERFAVLASRGPRYGPRDGVVLLRAREIDLSRLLEGATAQGFEGPARAWEVTLSAFAPMSSRDSNIASTSSVSVLSPVARARWAGESTRVASPDLTPGLFALQVLARDGNRVAPDAWVLVADSVHFARLATDFGEAVAITKRWGADANDGESRSALRAVLARLVTSVDTSRAARGR